MFQLALNYKFTMIIMITALWVRAIVLNATFNTISVI